MNLIYTVMINKYNEFILEKQFEEIISDIFRIVESEGRMTGDNTYEWDFSKKVDDSDISDRSLIKLKEFILKLSKEQARKYYIKLINKLKNLPDRLRRFLIMHYTSVFLGIASLGYLTNVEEPVKTDKSSTKVEQEIEPSVNSEIIEPSIKKEIIELHKKSSFEDAQSAVKEAEAGYSDDRDDTGNWVEVPGYGKRFVGTNHGISAPILQKYLGRIPKREDMEKLSYETALKIYRKDYWDAQNLGLLCDQSVANIIYDGCVNQGVEGMRQVISDAISDQNIKISGDVYSKKNIGKIKSSDQKKLFNSIKKQREIRYKNAPTWYKHGEGWMNRLSGIGYENNNDMT